MGPCLRNDLAGTCATPQTGERRRVGGSVRAAKGRRWTYTGKTSQLRCRLKVGNGDTDTDYRSQEDTFSGDPHPEDSFLPGRRGRV